MKLCAVRHQDRPIHKKPGGLAFGDSVYTEFAIQAALCYNHRGSA